MAQAGKVLVLESAGRAVAFLLENWRVTLVIAGVGALANGLGALALGGNLSWPLGALFIAVGVHAALLACALRGPRQAGARFLANTGRVAASMAIVATALLIFVVIVYLLGASILLGPYAQQIAAAGQDQAALQAIVMRAVEERASLALLLLAIAAAAWLALTSRLYLAAPASVDRGAVVALQSWTWTKGNTLAIMGARLAVLGPAMVLTGALQIFAMTAMGAPTTTFAALMGLAQADLPRFVAVFAVIQFIQIALYSTLEAGLAARLYRSLAPPSVV